MNTKPQIQQYIQENETRFLDELFSLIRIPSISSDPEHHPDMMRCALMAYTACIVCLFCSLAAASTSGMR